MANICMNRLVVTGDDFEVARFVKENRGKGCPLTFNASVPEERDNRAWWKPAENSGIDGDIIHTPEGDFQFNWWDWRITHWGTKWDSDNVSLDEDPGCAVYEFDTAYVGPTTWLKEVIAKYPMLEFRMVSCESGCDYLCFLDGFGGEYSLTNESYSDVLLTPDKKRAEVLRALEDEGLNPGEYDIDRIVDECEFIVCEDLGDIHNSQLEIWDCDFEEFKK